MIFHAPYGGWRRFYDLFKTRRFQIAEVIAFGDGAVLRFADGPADIKEVVLRGSNPLMLRLNGVDLEIVHFQFPPLTVSPLKDTAGELRRLTVFARASTARQDAKREAGLQLLKLLDHEIGTEEIIVNIRDDVWFVNVPGYPAFQPFVMDHEPPTAEEFQSRPQMVCAKTGSRVWCSE